MRKAAVVIAIVVTVAILAAAMVPGLVSMESYRPRVVAAIAAKTGRTASFSKISLTLLPAIAIRLSDFSLSGSPPVPAEPLVSAPVAEFRVAFRPFLAGRNEFSTLLLHRPKITVRQYPDGTHSAADVLERLARLDVLAPPDAGRQTSVTLKGIHVEKGALSILREEKGATVSRQYPPFSFRCSGIGAEEKPFSLEVGLTSHARGTVRLHGRAVHRNAAAGGGVSIRGKGEAFGQKYAAEGVLSAPRKVVESDFSISFPEVNVKSLLEGFPEYADAFSRLRPQGVARIDAKVSGDAQSLGFEAQADLTRAGWTIAEGLSKFIDAPCTLVIEGHRFAEALVVSNAEVRYPPLLLVGNASFSPGTGAREYFAAGRIASLEEFAKSRGEELAKWSPAGRVVLSVKGKRATGASPDAYLLEADLAGVGASIPGRGMAVSGFNGHVSVVPESVEFSPLTGLLNGQRFLLRGKVSRGDVPAGELELQMGYLDLSTLLPQEKAGGKRKRIGKEAALPAWLAEAWNRELASSVAVSIDAGNLWGVEFSRLSGRIRHEKGVLSFDGLRAALYGGEAVLSGALTGPGIDPGIKANVAMTNVEGSGIFRVTSTLGDFLSGKVSLSADVAGSRKDPASFLRTVTGTGSLRIVDGKMKGLDLPALAAAAAAPGRSTGAAAPGDTPFRKMESLFSLGGGKARLTGLRIDSGSSELTGDATIGLPDHTLELLGTLRLSKEWSKTPPWSGGTFFVGPSRESIVPLVVSGTLRSPAVAIDTTGAGRTPGRRMSGGPSGGGER